MPTISITVPTAQVQRILTGLGYQTTIPNPAFDPTADPPTPATIPNPESGAAFIQRILIEHVKSVVSASEAIAAANTAAESARMDVETKIAIT